MYNKIAGKLCSINGLVLLITAFAMTGGAQPLSFTNAADINVASPYSVVTADLNGDNKADVVTADLWGMMSTALGEGNGSFLAPAYYAKSGRALSVAVADFDGNGVPDVVVAGDGLSVFLGNGDGTFQAEIGINADTSTGVVAADFNGDGKMDIAQSGAYSGVVTVFLGNGDGTFQSPAAFAVGTGPYGLVAADFNEDGIPDIVTANTGSDTVSLLLGKGNGDFQAARDFAAGSDPVRIAVGDFNGDGHLDLAVTDLNSNCVSILLGNGDGTFQGPVPYAVGTGPAGVVAGDFDGDGRLDLAVANYFGTTISILLGKGDGTFQTASDFAVGSGPISLSAADVNGDGKLDLVVANQFSSTISVLLNTTTDTTPPVILSAVASPNLLWPPYGEMVPVRVTVVAHDNLDPAPKSRIIKVSSNESPGALPDWIITGDLSLELRAQRTGKKNTGRIYTILIQCSDASGNLSTTNVLVTVPHDNGNKLLPGFLPNISRRRMFGTPIGGPAPLPVSIPGGANSEP